MPSRRIASLAALAFAVTVAVPALADIPPPNAAQCRKAKEGDACETDDGKSGACMMRKCSRRDETYDCTLCVEGAPRKATKGCSLSGVDPGTAPPSWLALGLPLLLRRRRARRGG